MLQNNVVVFNRTCWPSGLERQDQIQVNCQLKTQVRILLVDAMMDTMTKKWSRS